MSASKASRSFEVLILGRLLFGLFCGLVMSLNPLYIQEVSPTNLRGAFATLNQVSFASGILAGMVSASLELLVWIWTHGAAKWLPTAPQKRTGPEHRANFTVQHVCETVSYIF